jgi:hypothetical protein
VPKITPKLAQRIFDHFHPSEEKEAPVHQEPEPAADCYNDRSPAGSKGGDST